MKGTLGGRYVPQKGRAGVYHDNNLDRLVCINWMRPTAKIELVRPRLAALQAVRSPYIALIYDLVQAGDKIGVVEEERGTVVPFDDLNRLRYLYEFCAGLAALHAGDLAHGALDIAHFRIDNPFGGRLGKLAFGTTGLEDPSRDYPALARCLNEMGADKIVDSDFQKLRSQLTRGQPLLAIALRDRLAALLLQNRHRALVHWRGARAELGASQRSARMVHPIAGVAAVKIEYDGTRFFLAEAIGEVKVNNVVLPTGAELPGSCVIALGNSDRVASQRYFITFDQSHPEVS